MSKFDTYLEKMDDLRETSDQTVDEMLKRLNVDAVIADPKKAMQNFALHFIRENSILFLDARKEGQKLVKAIK